MSELFGAPSGIIASDENIRKGVASGLQAQKLLGEIDQQPAEKAMKEAQGRYYGSLATEHEAKAADIQMLQNLESSINAGKAAGVDLTVGDLPKAIRPASAAEPFEEFVAEGLRRNVPVRLLAPMLEKGVTVRQHEAATASAQANEVARLATASAKQAERLGALAQWGLQSPAAYDEMRMQAANEGLPIDHLPQTWQEAQPVLQGIVTASISAKEAADLAIKKEHLKGQQARWKSQSARDAASIMIANARVKLTTERYNLLKKNGGEGSADVQELRRERILALRQRREVIEQEKFPSAPLDPMSRIFDKVYTAANGARFVWTKDPATGKGVAVLIAPGAALPAGTRSAPPDDDEDDD